MLLQRRLQLHGPSRPVLPVRPRRMWSLNQLVSTSMILDIKSRCGSEISDYASKSWGGLMTSYYKAAGLFW